MQRLVPILVASAVLTGTSFAGPPMETEYRVTFTATWSADTHPIDFPSNAHFSPMIGVTHDDTVVFWEDGGLATDGMESMAETGATATLNGEFGSAVAAGRAAGIFLGSTFDSPGAQTLTFTISQDHPLVTLVSMMAPSPDWFVGVSGVSLFEDGDWVPVKAFELVVWDAGTDSGATFTAPDDDTDPQIPIAHKDDYAFANGLPVGSFVFARTSVGVEPGAPGGPPVVLSAPSPNPMRASTSFTIATTGASPRDALVLDVRGRVVRDLGAVLTDAPTQRLSWDGRDGSGRRVVPGIYVVRIETGGASFAQKVVVAN